MTERSPEEAEETPQAAPPVEASAPAADAAPAPAAPPVEASVAADAAPAPAALPVEASAPAPDAAPAPAVASAAAPAAEAPAPRPDGDARREPREPRGDAGDRRRRFGRRKICAFCVDKSSPIDYKDPGKLRRYLSDRARIEPRRKTGTCAKHQRWLASALKRARHLALLPYTPEHIRSSGMFERGRR